MPKPINPIKRVDSLYAKCLGLIEKEVVHMEALAIANKLPSTAAKDLMGYIKLLGEMKEAHKAILDDKRRQAEKLASETSEVDLINATLKDN